MSTAEQFLAEVAVRDARGSVAAAYDEIQASVGVVALIYRFLATTPGLLERHWDQLAPNMDSPVAQQAVATLGRPSLTMVIPIEREALVDILDGARARNTLDAYRRANSLNLLAMYALIDGVDRPAAQTRGRSAAPQRGPLLPMADLSALAPATTTLLQAMAAPIAGTDSPVVIPSLWRHFANDPRVLDLLWSSLRPALTSERFATAVAAQSATARGLAGQLPYRVDRLTDPAARTVVERFVRAAIPGMLVCGAMIELALANLIDRSSLTAPA